MKFLVNLVVFFCIISCIGLFLFGQSFKKSDGTAKPFNLSGFVRAYDEYSHTSEQNFVQKLINFSAPEELGILQPIVNFFFTPIKLIMIIVNLIFDGLNLTISMFGFVFN